LFRDSEGSGFEFRRFFLPRAYFECKWRRLLLYIVSLVVSIGIYLWVSGMMEETRVLVVGSIAGGFHIANLLIYLKLYRLMRILEGDKRVLIGGVYYKGDEKYKKEALKFLSKGVVEVIKTKGYRTRLAFGEKQSGIEVFGGDVINEYVLMGKKLGESNKLGELKDVYFDFRDMFCL
jgi:hypothetical protein